jgi:hypothetical protein
LRAAAEKVRQATVGRHDLRAAEAKRRGISDMVRNIPSAPAPAVVSRNGTAVSKLDFLAELDLLFLDAHVLRDWSVRREGDRKRVTNPRMFDRSISRRLELLTTAIAAQKELWDLQRMEGFYTAIIDAIAAEAPDCARRIQERLNELDARTGMTCTVNKGG